MFQVVNTEVRNLKQFPGSIFSLAATAKSGCRGCLLPPIVAFLALILQRLIPGNPGRVGRAAIFRWSWVDVFPGRGIGLPSAKKILFFKKIFTNNSAERGYYREGDFVFHHSFLHSRSLVGVKEASLVCGRFPLAAVFLKPRPFFWRGLSSWDESKAGT
jgi:hypothetical protein